MKNTYTVVASDTLYKIAVRFKTTVAALALANKIKNINSIFSGLKILCRKREPTLLIGETSRGQSAQISSVTHLAQRSPISSLRREKHVEKSVPRRSSFVAVSSRH